jgi:hypothetical protein
VYALLNGVEKDCMDCGTAKHLDDFELSIAAFKSIVQNLIFILTCYVIKDQQANANAEIARKLRHDVEQAEYRIHELEEFRNRVLQHITCSILEDDDCQRLKDRLTSEAMDADLYTEHLARICLDPTQVCRHADSEEISMSTQDEWLCFVDA